MLFLAKWTKYSLGGDLVSVHFSGINAMFDECKEKSRRWKRVARSCSATFAWATGLFRMF